MADYEFIKPLTEIPNRKKMKRKRMGYLAGMILKDLAYEIIRLRDEPTTVSIIAEKLLGVEDKVLDSAGYLDELKGYLDEASKITGSKDTPRQFVKGLLEVRRKGPENVEKTVSRLLAFGVRFRRFDYGLFGLRSWSSNKIFQTYVQLASKYRNTDQYKKEFYKNQAIRLLESGEVEVPDKYDLVQTLRRL